MNTYYGFGPGRPLGDGGGDRGKLRLGGRRYSSIGGGCSFSFAKLKGWPFPCFALMAPYNFFSSLAKVNFSVFSPERCIDVITTTYYKIK